MPQFSIRLLSWLFVILGLGGCQRLLPYHVPREASINIEAGATQLTTDLNLSRTDLLPAAVDLSSNDDARGFDVLTVISLAPVADTDISSAFPNDSASNIVADKTSLRMGYCYDALKFIETMLRFEVPQVKVKQAKLKLYYYVNWGSQDYRVWMAQDAVWDENTLTWNQWHAAFPTANSTYVILPALDQSDVVKEIDVTSLIPADVQGGSFTFVLQGTKTSEEVISDNHENYAYSKEHTEESKRPTLVITY